MASLKDITGRRFGSLLVCWPDGKNANAHILWLCVCDCGRLVHKFGTNLLSGKTVLCGEGDHKKRAAKALNSSPEHRVWMGMVERCSNPNHNRYEYYGGRGIRVCDRWLNFENFYADMCPRPVGPRRMTIDRIDSNGNYEPGNCRWADYFEQARNQRPKRLNRNNRLITISGRTQTIAQWARAVGLSHAAFTARVDAGWQGEKLLTSPVNNWNRMRYLRKVELGNLAL
jgi:hypothetical protein